MAAGDFSQGLHSIAPGVWAWLSPPGSWNQSNAGLIADGPEALLIDTLVDARLTGEMLQEIERKTGIRAENIKTLVNTNDNSNHSWGNSLLPEATIIASSAAAEEMISDTGPQQAAKLVTAAPAMGALGEWFLERWSGYDFAGVKLRPPDRTFTGEIKVEVGGKDVHLIQVQPSSTPGDVIVYSPSDRVVFAGDVVFVENTPFTWVGPVSSWIAACDRLIAMDIDTIIPGHGPITDKAGVERMRDYLAYVDREARKRHAAGLDAWQAAQDIDLGEFAEWPDAGRLAITVGTIFREIEGNQTAPNPLEYFGRVQQLDARYA